MAIKIPLIQFNRIKILVKKKKKKWAFEFLRSVTKSRPTISLYNNYINYINC